MKPNNNPLSEYDLQTLLSEAAEIRKENQFLEPSIAVEAKRISLNVERLAEIRFLAQQHLEIKEKNKRHLRIVV